MNLLKYASCINALYACMQISNHVRLHTLTVLNYVASYVRIAVYVYEFPKESQPHY